MFVHFMSSKYSRVRNWTLGLTGGADQIAVIRASGSISRVRSPLSLPSSGIIGEQFIEKIRQVRGKLDCRSLFLQSNMQISFFLLRDNLFECRQY